MDNNIPPFSLPMETAALSLMNQWGVAHHDGMGPYPGQRLWQEMLSAMDVETRIELIDFLSIKG